MNVLIRQAHKNDLAKVAKAVTRISQDPSRHCIHSWSGDNAEALAAQLAGTYDDGELVCMVAEEDGQIIGSLCAEFDKELGRSWLLGPHVFGCEDSSHILWETIAPQLYDAVIKALPETIHRYDAYPALANTRLTMFYKDRGYVNRNGIACEFGISRDEYKARSYVAGNDSDLASMDEVKPEFEQDFIALYDSIFPGTYYSAKRVLAMRSEGMRVFSATSNGAFLGFAVASPDEGGEKAELHFLGVDANARGRGIGSRLLLKALSAMFELQGIEDVVLNVSSVHARARELYESVGFSLRVEGYPLGKSNEQRSA